MNFYKKKRSKYGNKKVECDGHKFDSGKERTRYVVLKNMEDRKEIFDLCLQPKFVFPVGFSYRADFGYKTPEGKNVIEDVKSVATKTRDYVMRVKCLKYFYPKLEFREIL